MRRPRKAQGAFPTIEKYNELVDIVNYLLDNAVVTAGAGCATQQLPQGKAVIATTDVNLKHYRIIGATPIDDAHWTYSVEEVRLKPDGWEIVTVPKATYLALNTAEENGLATDPSPEDTIVMGRKVADIGTGNEGVLFTYNVGEGSQLGLVPALIISSTAAAQAGKFVYTCGEAVFNPTSSADAYNSWTLLDEYGATFSAYNDTEVDDGEVHEAVPDGTVVRIHTQIDPDNATPYYWFHSPRGGLVPALIISSTAAAQDGKFVYTCGNASFNPTSGADAYNSWALTDEYGATFSAYNDTEVDDGETHEAVPDGTVVRIHTQIDPDNATPYYWFHSPRGGAGEIRTAMVISSLWQTDHWHYVLNEAEWDSDGEYGAMWYLYGSELDDAHNDAEYPGASYKYRPVPVGTIVEFREYATAVYWFGMSMNQDTNLAPDDDIDLAYYPLTNTSAETWRLEDDPSCGVIVEIVEHTYWDSTDNHFMELVRTAHFDDSGRLLSISAAVSRLVTDTVEC